MNQTLTKRIKSLCLQSSLPK